MLRDTQNFLAIKYWLQRREWYRPIHLAYSTWRASRRSLAAWNSIFSYGNKREKKSVEEVSEGTSRVLIATGTGGHLPSLTLDSVLGVALQNRRAYVEFLLCDGALPACSMCEINWYFDVPKFVARGPKDRCSSCYRPAEKLLRRAEIPQSTIREQLSANDIESVRLLACSIDSKSIQSFSIDGIPIGEHAMAGALRFYARGELEHNSNSEGVLRRYFESALLTYRSVQRLLNSRRYDVVVVNHGIYVPQGIIAEVARRSGVRVVTWHQAYRRNCFLFNHEETYHKGMLSEPTSSWESMKWSGERVRQIESYLLSRRTGEHDWLYFQRNPNFNVAALEEEVGISSSRPTIGLLTNVVWDAQLHYGANAFSSMLDWLRKTIEYFSQREDLQLLIRIHPAEITGTLPTRQSVAEEIRKAFPSLPTNVFVILPENKLSTYVAMSLCNAVIIYGTKTGVELSATGLPVIVAGEAWIRGKGISSDVVSETDYFKLLDSLPFQSRLDHAKKERALKYAFHFFFRRMIPLECVQEKSGWPPFEIAIQSESQLSPGSSLGLDIVCDGILRGTPFIYPAEELNTSNVA